MLFIANDAPSNAWLIRDVERSHEIQCILRPDWDTLPPPERRAHKRPPRPIGVRVMRRLRARYFASNDRRDAARLAQLLFPESTSVTPRAPVWTVPSWDINSVSVQEQLATLAPDLIIVSGAPLLTPDIFRIPRLGTVNLHFGISPTYRGLHTIVTPWQRGDFAHIGATLHRVTEGIDNGPVLFRVYPALDPNDDHVTAEAKIVRLAGATLCRMLGWLASQAADADIPGRALAGAGALIRYHDRSIYAHLRMQTARALVSRTEQRVELFYES